MRALRIIKLNTNPDSLVTFHWAVQYTNEGGQTYGTFDVIFTVHRR